GILQPESAWSNAESPSLSMSSEQVGSPDGPSASWQPGSAKSTRPSPSLSRPSKQAGSGASGGHSAGTLRGSSKAPLPALNGQSRGFPPVCGTAIGPDPPPPLTGMQSRSTRSILPSASLSTASKQ